MVLPAKHQNSDCFLLSAAAAQFLGADDLREDRGAHDGLRAKPQVRQHLPYEDTGDVVRDKLDTSRHAALDMASQVSYLLWYNSWERLLRQAVFFTLKLVGFQPAKTTSKRKFNLGFSFSFGLNCVLFCFLS